MSRNDRTAKPMAGWLQTYLPDIYYQDDEVLRNFLGCFEKIWNEFDVQIENLHTFFDPNLAPIDFLPWLGAWVGITLDEDISEKQMRELLAKAIWLHQRQGTAAALRERLRISVNAKDVDVQTTSPGHFRVVVTMPADSANDEKRTRIKERVKRIIEAEKPIYAFYEADPEPVKWPS